LTSITLPNSLISIGSGAFSSCSHLTSITLPNSFVIETILHNFSTIFENCNELTSISVDVSNEKFASLDGVLFSKNFNTLMRCPFGKIRYIIPSSVTKIAENAFLNCSKLTSITLPNSLSSIGKNAFYRCSNLQYQVKDNGRYLGNDENPYLFLTGTINDLITSLVINEKTTIIADGAFSQCFNLASIKVHLDNSRFVQKMEFFIQKIKKT